MEKTHFSWEQGWVFGFYQINPVENPYFSGFLKCSPIFTKNE